jgi:formylglycine-generating enzyme required for sulfatase activity
MENIDVARHWREFSAGAFLFVACCSRVVGLSSQRLAAPEFRDCAECPVMVPIPTGNFAMGSSNAEKAWVVTHGGQMSAIVDESPQHRVAVQAFAIGKYDVTRAEYAAFVRDTGYPRGDGCGRNGEVWKKAPDVNWERPGFPQTDSDPVVCVSWDDARAYVEWLNARMQSPGSRGAEPHGGYRLPTEAEWEYAARGGTASRFWWGDDDADAERYAWFKRNANQRTHSEGEKPANPFGLYDVVGNVWQWTQDCYEKNYAGAPIDGRAAEGDMTCLRVDRGGSWGYPTWLLRPAARERNPRDFRDMMLGFRVARTVPVR